MNVNIAIIILAYADFESLEISLAAHSKFLPQNAKMYILQNGRGTYDCERTYKVAKRYEELFPKKIEVVDWIKPQKPYYAINELLNSKKMQDYDYICKMDDDTFPITSNWLDELFKCYKDSENEYGEKLGYVTSLVNNNPWGFKRILDKMNLTQEFLDNYSMDHYCGWEGGDETVQYLFIEKGNIFDGGGGTVWRNAYISRWLHLNVTVKPDEFINSVKDAEYEEVDNKQRYSINCMLFKRNFWNEIDMGHCDDEHQTVHYCKKHYKKIIADLKVPMVHLFFYTQRDENKDLIPIIRDYYEKWLSLPYPISLCPNKEYENENRIRFIEKKLFEYEHKKSNNKLPWYQKIFSIRNVYQNGVRKKQIIILGLKFTYKKRKLK